MKGKPGLRMPTGAEVALVARRYYLDGKHKSEIARELGISRFKVARMLDEAREAGIVEFRIQTPAEFDLELGEQIVHKFGLRRAIVVRSTPGEEDMIASIGQAAAEHVASLLSEDDELGIAWGRSVTAMADALQGRSGADVIQVVGGVRATVADVSGVELVHRVAARIGGRAHPLHAPLLVGSVAIAQELLADPALADVTERFSSLTVCAVGVGSWAPPAQSALFMELTPEGRSELYRLGIAADVCGIPLDSQGRVLASEVAKRIVGVRMEQLARIPEVVVMAGGTSKAAAISAVLRAGIVTTMVTDLSAADALIRADY